MENARMERPWFRGRAETAGMGRHSPRHLCRVAHTIYVGLSLCSRREVRREQDDNVRHHHVNQLARSHRCWYKRRLMLRVSGIHWGSRQANNRHRRTAGDNVSISEDISDITERQCSRFSKYLPQVIIFARSGPSLLLHPFNKFSSLQALCWWAKKNYNNNNNTSITTLDNIGIITPDKLPIPILLPRWNGLLG